MSHVGGGQPKKIKMQNGATGTGNGTEMRATDVSSGGNAVFCAQVQGITTATITWEATIDGTNWVAVRAENLSDGAEATTATADGLYRITALGLVKLRARISSYTAGTINVTGVVVA